MRRRRRRRRRRPQSSECLRFLCVARFLVSAAATAYNTVPLCRITASPPVDIEAAPPPQSFSPHPTADGPPQPVEAAEVNYRAPSFAGTAKKGWIFTSFLCVFFCLSGDVAKSGTAMNFPSTLRGLRTRRAEIFNIPPPPSSPDRPRRRGGGGRRQPG